MTRYSPDSSLFAPLPPFEAYREDVERLGGQSPLGAADDAWLIAAHTLVRAAALPAPGRPSLLLAGVASVRTTCERETELTTEEPLVTAIAAADALSLVADHLARGVAIDPPNVDSTITTLQQLVIEMEQAGAFALAFTTLAALRDVIAPCVGPRALGTLLAQQGRAARQLGAIAMARELYQAAIRAGREARDSGVLARAWLGMGAIATMRGNYPDARNAYQRAAVAARRDGAALLRRSAHHGLLNAALAAGDLDTALAHGWAAVQLTSLDQPIDRAEMLVVLGNASLHAGEMRAALGASLQSLELTSLVRLRLPALGTALRASAALGEHRVLELLAREIERSIAVSGQPYENARALVELAEAFATLGDDRTAPVAERAREIARSGGFHEAEHRAIAVLEGHARHGRHEWRERHDVPNAHGSSVPRRSARARAAVRELETLSDGSRFANAGS